MELSTPITSTHLSLCSSSSTPMKSPPSIQLEQARPTITTRRSLGEDLRYFTPRCKSSPARRSFQRKMVLRPTPMRRREQGITLPRMVPMTAEETKLLELPSLPNSPRGVASLPRLQRKAAKMTTPRVLFQGP